MTPRNTLEVIAGQWRALRPLMLMIFLRISFLVGITSYLFFQDQRTGTLTIILGILVLDEQISRQKPTLHLRELRVRIMGQNETNESIDIPAKIEADVERIES